MDPQEADLARTVMGEICVVTRTKGQNSSSQKAANDTVQVISIRDRQDGWRAADVAIKGFRDNIYFHKAKGQVICGGNNWSKYRSGDYQPTPSKVLQGLPTFKGDLTTMERAIAVQWEGYADLFAGTIREIGNGATGTVAIVLPNNDGHCTGDYKASSRTAGTWSIKCTNGLAADGTYKAFGSGKGASGTGTDKKGRKVTYTMGGRPKRRH